MDLMPPTKDREPFDPKQPDGMRESDIDWARSNRDAVAWLAENHAAIRAALQPST